MSGGGFMALLAISALAGSSFEIRPMRLEVVLVNDPDFPPLEKKLVEEALVFASRAFSERFDVEAPRFEIKSEMGIDAFLGSYALSADPECKPLYAARYRGTGAKELEPFRAQAKAFFEKWPLESLGGFMDGASKGRVKGYDEVVAQYERRYVATVEAMKGLKTPKGTPLVEPERSTKRSFAAWTCALLRQRDFDVVLTNTFILADLLTEPHPHSVFGKAKIGGIATRSPGRIGLGGQAMLATTFGIDTKLPQFAELKGKPATDTERAKLLGAYLLAHEIAHAIFGVPDFFDHPLGCLMTSRPGQSYREGLEELDAHVVACERCRPWVLARSSFDRGVMAFEKADYQRANTLLAQAAKELPQQVHGGRKKRMAEILVYAARTYRRLGQDGKAKQWAELATKLDPRSAAAAELLSGWEEAQLLRRNPSSILVSRTSSTATVTAP